MNLIFLLSENSINFISESTVSYRFSVYKKNTYVFKVRAFVYVIITFDNLNCCSSSDLSEPFLFDWSVFISFSFLFYLPPICWNHLSTSFSLFSTFLTYSNMWGMLKKSLNKVTFTKINNFFLKRNKNDIMKIKHRTKLL